MARLLTILTILTIVYCNCNNQQTTDKDKVTSTIQTSDTSNYKGMQGTWVRHDKTGFTLIEIIDTSNIQYYQFYDRVIALGQPRSDRYWYYKSKATMGYWDNASIWISTDHYRFDYRLKGDTLIEYDKMGDQGTFIKVKEEKIIH